MIIVDCSALVRALTSSDQPGEQLRRRISGEDRLAAPQLLDAEITSALVGLAIRHRGRTPKLTRPEMNKAFEFYELLRIERYGVLPFWPRVADLSANLSAYDATYAALAELLSVPLVTCDSRLSKGYGSVGGPASIELH